MELPEDNELAAKTLMNMFDVLEDDAWKILMIIKISRARKNLVAVFDDPVEPDFDEADTEVN